MRILFMGTPEFAVPSLKALAAEHELVGVVTQPDRRAGRGQRLVQSPVKVVALELGLPIFQPERISDPQVMEDLEGLGAELFVVVAFGQKIPDRLLAAPKYGCINVHSSLLPKYRGAAPINAAIKNGDTVTGVTTMYLGSGWDDGDIILQAEEPIYPRDTAGALHDRLMVKGAGLLLETVRQIAQGTAPRIPQDHSQASYAFKLKKEDAKVEFHRTAWELDRLIRAMNPWPVAWAEIKGETVRIWEAWPGSGAGSPGEILSFSEEGLLVACGAGSLYLQKLQRPGGKILSGLDFANGLRLRVGEILSR
ncbi:methionyl-tRNA formyltransferase [Candidatus Darwinibacter acetoxidans]|jgi:methionyl-tRNA formyltransferase|nr:methionyl-tRNA formyltransferase [Limnochordia bacterium]HOB39724.1 methionyl-tRNA formyltransferase [Limnochordia bacterium]HOQ73360.1 methionyl-tRNA formyltransferase [Limnochordia bacterium]HPP72029.1 methionyl-tRNA formyltransferase [Limnochordia bacterium]HPU65400.1 methionyl-tRNA formyltransferase [Limnochordia bacterium]